MEKIKPSQEYDLLGLREVLPYKHVRTVGKIVQRDMEGRNLLQAEVTGESRRKRYKILGKNIIKFLKQYEPGLAMSVQQK